MNASIQDDFTCDVCEKSDSAHIFECLHGIDGNNYTLVRCDRCGMIAVWPPPSTVSLDAFYAAYEGKVKEGIVVSTVNPVEMNLAAIEDSETRLNYIEAYAGIKQRGKYLDIGCGHGFSVYAAQKTGYDALGIDIDPEAIEFGRNQLGIEITQLSVDDLNRLPLPYFDIITAWQVLEHLRMPGKCTRDAFALLKPGGVFAGSVPNIGGWYAKLRGKKWYMMIPPEHLNYFDETSMEKMLLQSGLTPLFLGTIPLYASPYFSLGVRMAITRFSETTSSKPVKIMCRWLYRGLTLVKRHIVYRLLNTLIIWFRLGGNSIFFVARRDNHSE